LKPTQSIIANIHSVSADGATIKHTQVISHFTLNLPLHLSKTPKLLEPHEKLTVTPARVTSLCGTVLTSTQ